MANISLTQACNRACTYCFSRTTPARHEMRLEDFHAVLDLLIRSGVDEARFVGGEPTLHPDFPSCVTAAIELGLRVRVFSNGLMPGKALALLRNLSPDRCSVLVNVPCPWPETKIQQQLKNTLGELGPRAGMGINIYKPRLPIESILPLIDQYGLQRTVRLGLAHPCLGADNAYLHPKHYLTVGHELLELFKATRERKIGFSFDCGFVPCMFPQEFWEIAGPAGNEVGGQCGPIPDILPDLTAIHCFALGNLEQYPISGIVGTGELIQRFGERLPELGVLGVFGHCHQCEWRAKGRCNGGCIAAGMKRFRGWEANPILSVSVHTTRSPEVATPRPICEINADSRRASRQGDPELTSPRKVFPRPRWLLPYIDQPAAFWEDLTGRHGDCIAAVYFPIPGGRIPSAHPLQPERHLNAFLQQQWLPKNLVINPVVLPAPAEQVFGNLLEELTRLVEVHGVESATVADLELAELVRQRFPQLNLTASVMMNIVTPEQAMSAAAVFHALVPGSGLIRLPDQIAKIKKVFPGKLRLLVNEGCLFGCALRERHFGEMADSNRHPESLCNGLLEQNPWLRVTGAWVLPQHLHLLDSLADEYKLAGRTTLHEPAHYLRVCDAYLHRTALWPHEIGGGPASPLHMLAISQGMARYLLSCGLQCSGCSICRYSMAQPNINRDPGR